MGNVLEDVTIPMHPVIDEIKREMTDAGALNAMMSGSGPTDLRNCLKIRWKREKHRRGSAQKDWQNRFM